METVLAYFIMIIIIGLQHAESVPISIDDTVTGKVSWAAPPGCIGDDDWYGQRIVTNI